MKMPAELKSKWLQALRSGKYAQTKEYLRITREESEDSYSDMYEKPVGYCCLGVLVEVAGGDIQEVGGLDCALPSADWLGANGMASFCEKNGPGLDGTGVEHPPYAMNQLYLRNDGYLDMHTGVKVPGVDFNAIADYIEANIEGV